MDSCTVADCGRNAFCRGMCGMHYARWHKHGDPNVVKVGGNPRPAHERFWEKVAVAGPLDCWLWFGTIMGKGYGQFYAEHKRMTPAHRWAYESIVGPIPEGMQLDHVWARGCRYKNCVNPAHLEVVDNRTNGLRGNNVSGVNSRKTHCPQGHPFDGDNVRYVQGKTFRRVCRTCERESGRRYKARQRAH